ncbi:tryptophan halogenase family protein [Pseudoxanthomonas dokdonensis]|uniref:Tryptophan halogenase n=1 Tax=Pseudoxanthomonas dokdonensis TaxID=344882 RepID=A0A0R0CN88_9GAMM|nr:tryptophan halogenase family protein [Pseudoxanthomonas dokdonensis]KRG71484.1 tryptophan halogenase [Pseudoxanthomonas dokdonensis]
MPETTDSNACNRPIRRVVIAGGGTAGWMAAAALSRTLGKVLDIKLIESDEISTVGVGEATIPTLVTFHRLLDINEQEFMAATQATFKLGISFENWRDVGQDYIHSFGITGKDHWSAGFQHFWLKGRERQLASDYGDYCLELKASQQNRFAHLPKGGMNYAFHMDAGLYARYLRRFSEGFGAQRIEGKIVEVCKDDASGHIRSLMMDSGEEIEGDLFIDCTGFRGLLIGQTLGAHYQDWSQWLHCDSAIALQTRSVGEAIPLTRSIAREAGWQWRIPLQHRVGNGIVFSSQHWDDEQALRTLRDNIEGEVLTEPRVIRFKPGQRSETWIGNCVALGLSSGFLEPIESTSIHLIQRGIVRLLQMFPASGISPADVAEYNQQTRNEIEHIRDFIILHYHVTQRRDSAFWRGCREMEIPASLQHRIDLFRQTGRVFRVPNELFAENSWVQVMLGQGLVPEQRHPVADLMDDGELARFLDGIRDRVNKTVAQLPAHQTYVQTYCPGERI